MYEKFQSLNMFASSGLVLSGMLSIDFLDCLTNEMLHQSLEQY